MRHSRPAKGFTLMEVTIALGIFAVLAVVLLDAVAQVQQAIHESKIESDRTEFRHFVMRQALSAADRNDAVAGGSTVFPDGSTASWSLALEPTELPDLHSANLEITWDEGEPENFTIRVYRPEWSDATTRSAQLRNHATAYPPSRLSTF
jgi:prepilin-type N-terminal cleavage/methylation domain-containing protein